MRKNKFLISIDNEIYICKGLDKLNEKIDLSLQKKGETIKNMFREHIEKYQLTCADVYKVSISFDIKRAK